MFTYFAVVSFTGAVVYVWMKRTEVFFVKLACSLVFGSMAYLLALGMGLMANAHFPSKWLVEHVDLVSLYQSEDKAVILETVLSNGKEHLHFKRKNNPDSEFVLKDGDATVHEEGTMKVLRIHRKEFVDWGYWLAWLTVSEPSKYDFIVPKDNRKNVLDN